MWIGKSINKTYFNEKCVTFTIWKTFEMTQSDPIHIVYFIKTTYVSVKISLLGSRTMFNKYFFFLRKPSLSMAMTYQTKVYVHFKYGKDLELELDKKETKILQIFYTTK